MANSARFNRSTSLLIGAAVLLTTLGVGLGYFAAAQQPPAPLATAATVMWYPVEQTDFIDARSAELTITLGQPRSLRTATSGLVTKSRCRPGATIRSGHSTFSIDGRPLLNLATKAPLWRPISRGTSGADVAALHKELTRLGHPASGSLATSATFAAMSAVAKDAGVPFAGRTIDPADIVWLPSRSAVAMSCLATVGDQVDPTTELAQLPQSVISAKLSNIPTNLATGRRVFTTNGLQLDMTTAGQVTSEDLPLLARSQQWSAVATDNVATTNGTFRLATSIPVYAVPPTALGDVNGAATCVVTPEGSKNVSIVGSELGVTYLDADVGTIAEVSVDPNRSRQCS